MDSQIFFFNIWRFTCLLHCECRRVTPMAYGLAPRKRMGSCHHYVVLYDIFVNRGLSPIPWVKTHSVGYHPRLCSFTALRFHVEFALSFKL